MAGIPNFLGFAISVRRWGPSVLWDRRDLGCKEPQSRTQFAQQSRLTSLTNRRIRCVCEVSLVFQSQRRVIVSVVLPRTHDRSSSRAFRKPPSLLGEQKHNAIDTSRSCTIYHSGQSNRGLLGLLPRNSGIQLTTKTQSPVVANTPARYNFEPRFQI